MTRHQVERGNEPPAASSVRTAATCANTAFAAVRAGAPAPMSTICLTRPVTATKTPPPGWCAWCLAQPRGLLPSNAQALFRSGHGAMDFGAGLDHYLRGNRCG